MGSVEKSGESLVGLLGSFVGCPVIKTFKSVESIENPRFIKNNFQCEL